MAQLFFDEKTMLDGNIFQYEDRLHSFMNKYVENGAILTTYYTIDELESTVDRGTRSIDELFGENAPLRYKKILDFPLYAMHANNPEDVEEINGTRDMGIEGDVLVIPGTLVPHQLDFFVINHLKMRAIFEITSVTQDSMKVDGYYKLHYRLYSTEEIKINDLEKRVSGTYHTDLNLVGSNMDPVIKEDHHIKRKKVYKLLSNMIEFYKIMYYNERHNCMLFVDENNDTYFDRCCNEFLYRHNLMNIHQDSKVIMLNDKLSDPKGNYVYDLSIYKWLEMGASVDLLQRFPYIILYAGGFTNSSFNLWDEGDIKIIQPTSIVNGQNENKIAKFLLSEDQINTLMDDKMMPNNVFDLLLWKYIHFPNSIGIDDIDDSMIMPLLNDNKYSWDTFFYVPIMIFIINEILNMK